MNIKNILDIASTIIGTEVIQYRKFLTKEIDHGQVVPTYDDWKNVRACVQPGIVSSFGGKNISLKDYKELGLDWTKCYYTIWATGIDITTVYKQDVSDQIKWGDRILNVMQVENWTGLNGWKRCYCVERVDEEDEEVTDEP